jgi:hypothetical protein
MALLRRVGARAAPSSFQEGRHKLWKSCANHVSLQAEGVHFTVVRADIKHPVHDCW